MSGIVPTAGIESSVETLADELDVVAVGTGSTEPSSTDTSLESEVYRASVSDSVVDIKTDTNNGQVVALITVSGGTEVPAGTEITELGVFYPDGSLFYREVTNGTTIGSGETATFELSIDVVNV